MATGWPMKTTYANGDVYSASDVNDITGTINLLGQSVTTSAGKNAVINGGFDIWQRGTSSTSQAYQTADRFYGAGATTTFSQETSDLPSGFTYAMKMTATGTTAPVLLHAIETQNCIQYAGQTVILSYYVKSSNSTNAVVRLDWSATANNGVTGTWTTITSNTKATTTSYTRISNTFAVPSTAKSLRVVVGTDANLTTSQTMLLTGVQLELGSTTTTFSRAGGTIQGELAACQRYYYRINATASAPWSMMAYGSAGSTTIVYGNIPLKADMRVIPTSVDYSNLCVSADNLASAQIAISSATVSNYISPGLVSVNLVGSGFTQYRPYWCHSNNTSAGYLGVSAEL
jgi:hypothetical protein